MYLQNGAVNQLHHFSEQQIRLLVFLLEVFGFVGFEVRVVLGVGDVDITVPVHHETVSPHEQRRRVQFVVHGFAYFQLHLPDFGWGVAVVSGLGEFSRRQRLKLLEFGSDEHGGSAGQLEVSLGQVSGFLEIFVDQCHSEVIGLSFEPELVADVHHPIDEYCSHEPI